MPGRNLPGRDLPVEPRRLEPWLFETTGAEHGLALEPLAVHRAQPCDIGGDRPLLAYPVDQLVDDQDGGRGVEAELARRFGVSGLEDKESRQT